MMDWRALSQHAKLEFTPDGESILVTFDDGRRQEVRVAGPHNDTWRVWSIVQSAIKGRDRGMLLSRACRRNETTDLVGFKLDGEGQLIGEAWVPIAGIEADEWGMLVRHVARTCDRFEHALTGLDVR